MAVLHAGLGDVDRLDIRLIGQLSQGRLARGRNIGVLWGDIEPSYGELARILNVSRETVRARVNRMRSSGFLRVFPVQVNPTLLGLKLGALAIDLRGSGPKEELVPKLSLVEGVHVVQLHVGTLLGVVFTYEDDAMRRRRTELVSSISSAAAVDFTPVPFPPSELTLSKLDWQIVSAMQEGGAKPSSGVWKGLHISERSVRRRVKRMVEGWAIAGIISFNVRALREAVMASLLVYYSPGEDRSKTENTLLSDLDEYIGLPPSLWTDWSVYTLILPSVSEMTDVLQRTKDTKGVQRARMELIEDRFESYDTLQELVRKRARGALDLAPETTQIRNP